VVWIGSFNPGWKKVGEVEGTHKDHKVSRLTGGNDQGEDLFEYYQIGVAQKKKGTCFKIITVNQPFLW